MIVLKVRPALRYSTLVLVALTAASCSGDRFTGDAATPTAAPAARPAPPPVNMAGRWRLASPGGGQCNMNFGGAPGAAEGTIAPAGGCPGNFFTSRKWTYDSSGLLISNHNSEPLGRLTAEAGSFNGQSTSGQPITLTR
jgi:hypothetical protein